MHELQIIAFRSRFLCFAINCFTLWCVSSWQKIRWILWKSAGWFFNLFGPKVVNALAPVSVRLKSVSILFLFRIYCWWAAWLVDNAVLFEHDLIWIWKTRKASLSYSRSTKRNEYAVQFVTRLIKMMKKFILASGPCRPDFWRFSFVVLRLYSEQSNCYVLYVYWRMIRGKCPGFHLY